MRNFNLSDFKKGLPAKTMTGESATFFAMLDNNIPAPMLVNIDGTIENYYINGAFLGEIESEHDLTMVDLPQCNKYNPARLSIHVE